MWVAPAVSFAVIAGFFSMLAVLLWQEYNPRTPATEPPIAAPTAPATATTPAAAATTPAATATTPAAAATTRAAAGTTPAVGANTPAAGATTPPATTNPNSLQNVLFTLLGALGAAFTQVVNFWLGSSKGSSDKTDLLAATNPALAPKAN